MLSKIMVLTLSASAPVTWHFPKGRQVNPCQNYFSFAVYLLVTNIAVHFGIPLIAFHS